MQKRAGHTVPAQRWTSEDDEGEDEDGVRGVVQCAHARTRYDERILLPYHLALGNRLLRDEAFALFPIEILDFDGRRPSGDVEAFNERMWLPTTLTAISYSKNKYRYIIMSKAQAP